MSNCRHENQPNITTCLPKYICIKGIPCDNKWSIMKVLHFTLKIMTYQKVVVRFLRLFQSKRKGYLQQFFFLTKPHPICLTFQPQFFYYQFQPLVLILN